MDARKTQGKGSNRMQTYEGRGEGVKRGEGGGGEISGAEHWQ
jgi:hypothetical protein